MKNRAVSEILFTLFVILICLFAGMNLGDILTELFWFYVVLILIGGALSIYIGYWLTRAMNPRRKEKEKDDEQIHG